MCFFDSSVMWMIFFVDDRHHIPSLEAQIIYIYIYTNLTHFNQIFCWLECIPLITFWKGMK